MKERIKIHYDPTISDVVKKQEPKQEKYDYTITQLIKTQYGLTGWIKIVGNTLQTSIKDIKFKGD